MEPRRGGSRGKGGVLALKELLPCGFCCVLVCLFSACAVMVTFGCENGPLAPRVAASVPSMNGNGRSSFMLNPMFRGGGRDPAAGESRRRTNPFIQGRRLGLVTAMGPLRRHLRSGPGSHPPRCGSKCGSCTPCTPVHVAVPPGTPVITEYYPETWRCKCADKLYVP